MDSWRRLLLRTWFVAPLLLSAWTAVAADNTAEGAARLPAALHADGHGGRKEAGGGDQPRTGDSYSPIQPPECWVFSHMNKSGGESVKAVLKAWTDRRNASSPPTSGPPKFTMRWYDDPHWRSGEGFAHKYLSRRPTVSVGAYTQGLLAYGQRRCMWFTIFRHPVHRLVSAFFYCKTFRGDPLCATFVLDARTADLGTFAKHWGNFGMRQFLLAFVPWEDVSTADGVDDSICKLDDDPKGKNCPGWYRLKKYVESRGAFSSSAAAAAAAAVPIAPPSEGGSTAPNEPWMHQFLRPVEDLLSHKYAAVGVLEEFDMTLALFNSTLQMPDLDWATSFQEIGARNGGRFARAEADLLVQAWADPDIQAALWLDILLYDHAVGVFNRQAAEHGLLALS